MSSVWPGGKHVHCLPGEIETAAIGHDLFDAGDTGQAKHFGIGFGDKLREAVWSPW